MDELAVIDSGAPAAVFREAWERDGVFVIKGLFDADLIKATRLDILRVLYSSGWITNADDEYPLANLKLRCAHPDLAYLRTYRRALKVARLYQLPHCESVDALAGRLGMGELFRLPRVILRVVFPGSTPTPAHQDWATVRGYQGTATLWVPLIGCPLGVGPVCAIPGSHRRGLWERTSGTSLQDEVVIVGDEDRWAAADVGVTDAVLFRSLTVHRALPNVSQLLRLSIDFRMQPLSEVLHPGSLLPPDGFRTWDDVYGPWTGAERRLSRYWRERHPPVEPASAGLRRAIAAAQDRPAQDSGDRPAQDSGDEIREMERMLAQVEDLDGW